MRYRPKQKAIPDHNGPPDHTIHDYSDVDSKMVEDAYDKVFDHEVIYEYSDVDS